LERWDTAELRGESAFRFQRVWFLPDLRVWTVRNFWERPSHPSIERVGWAPTREQAADPAGSARDHAVQGDLHRVLHYGLAPLGGESEILAEEATAWGCPP